MNYLQLFLAFLQIGFFSFGGGYAALALMRSQIVQANNWITMSELADIITISGMTPGPISINTATFVGFRVAGIGGAVVALIGLLFCPFILSLLLARIYQRYKDGNILGGILRGLSPAVVGTISAVAISIIALAIFNEKTNGWTMANINWIAVIILFVNLVLLRKFKINQVYLLVASGFLGLLIYSPLLQ